MHEIGKTQTLRLAQNMADRLRNKRDIAFRLLASQGADLVSLPFDDLWSDADAIALDNFDHHIRILQSQQLLPIGEE